MALERWPAAEALHKVLQIVAFVSRDAHARVRASRQQQRLYTVKSPATPMPRGQKQAVGTRLFQRRELSGDDAVGFVLVQDHGVAAMR